jgi:rhamnosyltransferase
MTRASLTPTGITDVGGVVVAYNPDRGFEERLTKVARQVNAMIIVDNSDADGYRQLVEGICRQRGWILLSSGRNEGVGAALNRGVLRLISIGFRWALLFDQDSEPASTMCNEMIASLQRHPQAANVAVVGPNFVDTATGRSHRILRRHPRLGWWFKKVQVGDSDLPAVTMVITSGSLLRVDAFLECGGFDETLFIDYVDTDFCLKCLAHGWLIAVSATAKMTHSFGQRNQRRFLGFNMHPTNHSPLRHFYISRNRIAMWKRHASKAPHWAWFDLAAVGLWIFRVLAAETQKSAKIAAMIRGTCSGLRNETGKAAELSSTNSDKLAK